MLANAFVLAGHVVRLITQTVADDFKSFPFEVVRQPNARQLFSLVRWCDVYFHNNLSLQTAWPLIFTHRPWIVAHHTWISRSDGSLSWQDYLKRYCIRFATCISISRAVASHIPISSVVIPNPYQDDLFYQLPGQIRDRDLVFVGRLVSDKGVDLLLEALGRLKLQGLTPTLSVVGVGPEEANLRQLAKKLGLVAQIDFAGLKQGLELAHLLRTHKILVVPSHWPEPFGIVAIEGIACGCVVVGSGNGGLKDAMGPCGVTFPNGDTQSLARLLAQLLLDPGQLETYRDHSEVHLARHRGAEVAKAYLEVLEAAVTSLIHRYGNHSNKISVYGRVGREPW